ncbi:MAG: replication initiator protein A [Lachnospiraceae bacterium]|nr:replication initiator protein A [Lachnospiraceae bacterium]
MSKFEYDYYSGEEADQFRFLRIPKVFFEDPDYENLGSDEKILYGFLHEQVDLSRKKEWIDEEGRIYVMRSLESIQKILHNCSVDKARATLKNLVDFGLIEKKRSGLGKPDLIYVKNFITKKRETDSSKIKNLTTEKSTSEKNEDCGQLFSEVGKTQLRSTEKPKSGSGKFRSPEVGKTNPIDTIYKYTEFNETPSIYHEDIDTSGDPVAGKASTDGLMDGKAQDEDRRREYEDLIKRNLDYDTKMFDLRNDDQDRKMFDDLYNLILEIVVGDTPEYKINGTVFPQAIVKSRMLKLNGEDLLMAIQQINSYPEKIHNIRSFMISTLYNASVTTRTLITNDVQYRSANGLWKNGTERMEA